MDTDVIFKIPNGWKNLQVYKKIKKGRKKVHVKMDPTDIKFTYDYNAIYYEIVKR